MLSIDKDACKGCEVCDCDSAACGLPTDGSEVDSCRQDNNGNRQPHPLTAPFRLHISVNNGPFQILPVRLLIFGHLDDSLSTVRNHIVISCEEFGRR